VRDAIDRVIGGAIRMQTASLPTGKTYRFHTQRLTANDPLIFTGLLLALGQRADRPISAWEEMFLPLAMRDHVRRVTLNRPDGTQVPLVTGERTLFQSSASPPPDTPPSRLPWYLLLGAVTGSVAAAFGGLARRHVAGRLGLGVMTGLWGSVAGLGGVVLGGLWGFTDHAMAYHNENLFQVNPLVLGLAVLGPLGLAGSGPARRWAPALALGLATLSLAGLVLQVLPGLDQVNGPVIALALPIHVGVAIGLRRALLVSP
jgi:hypothetical protein